jgi:hypothetical protein
LIKDSRKFLGPLSPPPQAPGGLIEQIFVVGLPGLLGIHGRGELGGVNSAGLVNAFDAIGIGGDDIREAFLMSAPILYSIRKGSLTEVLS